MQSKAATVSAYLASLAADRRAIIQAVRDVILKNLDSGYQEAMQYGMIGYSVPHSLCPEGYHCDPKQPLPFAGLASQKNHMAIYLMCTYGDAEHNKWFRDAWAKSGKKLDMGKSCIRFKKLDDLALDVIGQAIRKVPAAAYVKATRAMLEAMGKGPRPDKPRPSASAAAPSRSKPSKKTTKKTAKKVARKAPSKSATPRAR